MTSFKEYVSSMPKLNRLELTYNYLYCEENVYKLAEHIRSVYLPQLNEYTKDLSIKHDFYAVFLTNQYRQTYILQQKQGDRRGNFVVCFDYHVILVHKVIFKLGHPE